MSHYYVFLTAETDQPKVFRLIALMRQEILLGFTHEFFSCLTRAINPDYSAIIISMYCTFIHTHTFLLHLALPTHLSFSTIVQFT